MVHLFPAFLNKTAYHRWSQPWLQVLMGKECWQAVKNGAQALNMGRFRLFFIGDLSIVEMAQWENRLPGKHEVLSLIPKATLTTRKAWHDTVYLKSQCWGGRITGIPGVSILATPTYLMSSISVWNLFSEWRWMELEEWQLKWPFSLHMHEHTCEPAQMVTHSDLSKWANVVLVKHPVLSLLCSNEITPSF